MKDQNTMTISQDNLQELLRNAIFYGFMKGEESPEEQRKFAHEQSNDWTEEIFRTYNEPKPNTGDTVTVKSMDGPEHPKTKEELMSGKVIYITGTVDKIETGRRMKGNWFTLKERGEDEWYNVEQITQNTTT